MVEHHGLYGESELAKIRSLAIKEEFIIMQQCMWHMLLDENYGGERGFTKLINRSHTVCPSGQLLVWISNLIISTIQLLLMTCGLLQQFYV